LTLPFLYSIGNFGYGFHVGSSFPMSKTPQGSQSDIYGRPYGLKKIHIVDASIFPSIPASTITYTVMANSYRIGDLYADYKNDN
jgi:choline dehydrogenase-like flavoprotein